MSFLRGQRLFEGSFTFNALKVNVIYSKGKFAPIYMHACVNGGRLLVHYTERYCPLG